MCIGAIVKVKCKHCLAKGLDKWSSSNTRSAIRRANDPVPFSSGPRTQWQRGSTTRSARQTSTRSLSQMKAARNKLGSQDSTVAPTPRPGYWTGASKECILRAPRITQGGAPVEFSDPDEERATVQDWISALFQDFGKELSTHGKPEVDFKCKEMESGELVSTKVQWPCLGLCKEAEGDWMLIQSEIMICP